MAVKPLRDIMFGNPRQPGYQPPKEEMYDWLITNAVTDAVGSEISTSILALLDRATSIEEGLGGLLSGSKTLTEADAEPGFVQRANGADSSTVSGWLRTGFIQVGANTIIRRQGSSVSSSSAATGLAFYDATKAWISSTTSSTADDTIVVGDLVPAAAYVRISSLDIVPLTVTITPRVGIENVKGLAAALEVLEQELAATSTSLADTNADLAEQLASLQTLAARATSLDQFSELLRSLVSGPKTFGVSDLVPGFYSRTDGSIGSTGSFKRTALLPVVPSTRVTRTGSTISTTSAAGTIVFFDRAGLFLGVAGNGSATNTFFVGDLYPTAAFIGVTNVDGSALTLTLDHRVARSRVEGLANLGLLEAALVKNFFAAGTTVGYVKTDGAFTSPNANWETTDFIPAVVGDKFVLTATASGTVSIVSYWNADKQFIGNLVLASADGLEITVALAGTAFIRATAQVAFPRSVFGVKAPSSAGGSGTDDLGVVAHVPSAAYGIAGEPLYIYPRGIVADRSVSLSMNLWESNEKFARVVTTTPGPDNTQAITPGTITATLRARRGDKFKNVKSFPVRLMNGSALVNPSAPRNVFCLGDSLTHGSANSGIQGAYPNELSRRLNGVGTALMTGDLSPAPRALTNMLVKGSQGDQPIKHNGHPGWSANTFLTRTDAEGSPYWSAALGRFSWKYFIENNGFHTGPSGVTANGSNMTLVIELGWNNLSDPVFSTAARLGDLIDSIRAEYAACDIILLGINPAPELNFKDSSGRFVSGDELFNDFVRPLGEAYRALAVEKSCDYLQTSHVFNPDVGYPTKARRTSFRGATELTASWDHVHCNAAGYAMMADAVFYYLLWKYCQ